MATVSAPYRVESQPTNLGYGIAALIAIGGVILAIGLAVSGAVGALTAPDHFDRTTVGGALTTRLEAGTVAIYVEARSVPTLDDLRLTVMSSSGAEVAVTPYRGTLQYDRNGGLGTAVGTFTAPAAGPYQVVSRASRTVDVIAVGPDIADRLGDALDQAALVAAVAIGIAVVLAIGVKSLGKRRPQRP